MITRFVSGLLIGVFSVAAAPAVSADDAETARCKAMVQDQVAWDATNSDATHWQEENLDRLCSSGLPAESVVMCFKDRLSQTNDWDAAITACTQSAEPQRGSETMPPEPDTGGDQAPPRPSATAEWVDGKWVDVDGVWMWEPGHWEEPGAPKGQAAPDDTGRAPAAAVWVDGKWVLKNGIWEWEAGHWEEPEASATSPLVAECRGAIQGNVSWDPDDPSATRWTEEDLSRICQSTAVVRDTIACFTEILAETRSKEQALSMCSRLHPSNG